MAEHWAYFGDEVDALAERRNLSREDAREALLDEVEGGLRQSEAKVWVAREVEGCWLCELVYDPAHDPPAFDPLSPGFWTTARNEEGAGRAEIVDRAHAVTMGGRQYRSIRLSPLGEEAGNHAVPVQQKEPRVRRGGPPLKFDWHAFYREIVAIAHFDGLPERDELTKHMKDFVASWSDGPADSTVREKMAEIYERLARGR